LIEELMSIEQDAAGNSPIHRLDGRVKLVAVLLFIIMVVGFPISPVVIYPAVVLFAGIALLWLTAGLSPLTYIKRVIAILPFGFFIIVFQIFFKNPYYQTYTPLDIPFLTIYAESVEFAGILAVKFLLCISGIILLSSTTPVQELLMAGRRLGLPTVLALSLGMLIRYLYLFADMYCRIQYALMGRNFHPFDRKLPYKYRLRTLGYAMGSLFLRSYEQGERTYVAMLCRGYGSHTYDHIGKKPLKRIDTAFLISVSCLIPIILTVGFFLIP